MTETDIEIILERAKERYRGTFRLRSDLERPFILEACCSSVGPEAETMRLSILICTRNGGSTICEAIACVGRQVSVNQAEYEVIVVDNGSTEDTSSRAAEALQLLPCRKVFLRELREGKLNAILSGLAASNAPLISIVDDDNFISEEFILRTLDMFDSFPELGVVGSVNTLLADNPPAWFELTAGRFACSEPWFEGEIRRIDGCRRIARFGVIAGAGSTFRKRPLLAALGCGFVFMNDAFRGRTIVSGGDTELCYLFHQLGYWFGADERIRLRHKINPSRLNWPYARKLSRSQGAGALALDGFALLSNESMNSPLKQFRATWQWMAARRLRRIATLLPAVAAALLAERKIDPVWLRLEEHLGALARICRERGIYTARMQAMWESDWSRLRKEHLAQ